MKKTNVLLFLGVTLAFGMFLISESSAQEIWYYNNFYNYYDVYDSFNCNIKSLVSCPNELGWQGDSLGILFRLGMNKSVLGTKANFTIYVSNILSPKPIDISVNGKLIASNYVVSTHCSNGICPVGGAFIFPFDSKYLKPGRQNSIIIHMENVEVGYGAPSQGFVISAMSLQSNA